MVEKKGGTIGWDEKLFDKHLNYDWRKECEWNNKMLNSGKNQFDVSFGYELTLRIPFENLQKIDVDQTNISGLKKLIEEVYYKFNNELKI